MRRTKTIVLASLVPAGAALLVAACRQTIGIDQYFNAPADAGWDGGSVACGLPYGTGTCASCAQANCCVQSHACSSGAACTTYQTCIGKCSGDPGCRSQCMIGDPGVAHEVSALSACLAANCETQCGLTCSSMVERLTPPDAGAPCETCFQNQGACKTARACASSVDCDEYTRCFVACPTPDCREACATEYDAGAALFAPVQQIYKGACSMACAYGQNWNCVGHVVYPATSLTSVTLTGTVLDYNGSGPVSGVNLCLSYSCPTCGAPGQPNATTQTDADGGYSYTLQLPAISPFGGTTPGFQGCITFSSPDIVTQWGYIGFPQTHGIWSVSQAYAAQMIKTSELATSLAAIEATWDPSRAMVSARVYDCLGTPAPNVRVALDPASQDSQTTVFYYTETRATSISATSDAATSTNGLVVFFDVPAPDAGSVNVSLTATPVGLGMASSHETAGVQAGVISAVEMTPTP